MMHKTIYALGMPLDAWRHKSSIAEFGVGEDCATLYHIRSMSEGQGHATELLAEAKRHYEKLGKVVGSTVALTSRMKGILDRLGIPEYSDDGELSPLPIPTPSACDTMKI
jgi:hypothetical protein